MTRGWTSYGLPLIGDDRTLWTIAEAADHLGPLPGDPEDMPKKAVITKLRILASYYPHDLPVVGKRRTGQPDRPGRCARAYRAASFVALYAKMDPGNDEKPPAAA